MFAHLNTHSIYSKMSGTATFQEILRRAKKFNFSHLAMTETNGLYGFIRFIQAARDFGIQPIAGTNIVTPNCDVILLAENQSGYENICRLLSMVHDEPTITVHSLFQKHRDGFFILSYQKETLAELVKIFPSSHLFMELRPTVTEQYAKKMANQFGIDMVATGDVYFLEKSDQKSHKILRAIEKNATLSQLTKDDVKGKEHYFCPEKEMIRRFPNSLEAINNSQYLAERCKTDWQFLNTIFPEISLKDTHKANQLLHQLVYEGAKIRFETITDEIKQRIEYELEIITQKGFSPYFLVVHDIIQKTKATIGRGSGAASIVSYCLFITQVDPIRYNLQFERFIHPERVDMPDIDIDFPWDERDDILDYVFENYGLHRTAMVSSQVFLQPRSAIREVSKVYGLSNEEIKAVTKRIGYFARPPAPFENSDMWRAGKKELAKWISTDQRFKDLDLDETLSEIIEQSEKIIGAFRVSSVHPGGIIIVPDEIRKYVPVLTAPKGVQIVEWEKDQVEDSGLLKIDLLGNRSLAVVRDTLKQIGLYRDKRMDYHTIQPNNDPKTEALMQSGKTMGIFYIESPATRLLLTKAGVVDFEHVVIYSSIIRPAANRYINLMLERIHGKQWELLHPDLHFLNESYGIMVYEEQVSMTAREIAGFGYAESDHVRKAISRPALADKVPLWKRKFITGAENRGYTRELAETLWEMIESFSGYSFCKPHSASYAMLSFTCAYLKAHYPAEFLSSVITNQGGYYSTYAYLSEARRFGIKILPPDINRSERFFKGRKNQIRIGFMAINHLQKKAIDEILEERKAGDFSSISDFLIRSDLELSDLMALTNAGCFVNLEPDLTHREIAFQIACFKLDSDESESLRPSLSADTLTDLQKRELEFESFGFPISEHPLERYSSVLQDKVKKAKDIPQFVGKTINLLGVYITRKVTSTKKREPMEFVTFEDETNIYECVMFPKPFKQFGDLLNWEKLFILRGKVEESFGVCTVTIEKLGSLQQMMEKIKKVA